MGLTWWVGGTGEGCASCSIEVLFMITCTLLSVSVLLDELSSLSSLFTLTVDSISLVMFSLVVVVVVSLEGTGEGTGDEA